MIDVTADQVRLRVVGIVRDAEGRIRIDDLASLTDEFIHVLSLEDARDVLIRMRDKLREVQANGAHAHDRDP